MYDTILKTINANKFSELLGIRLTAVSEGRVTGEIVLDSRHLNPPGSLHGGVISAFMDVLSSSAAITRGTLAPTSSVDIHFLSSVHETKKITGLAKEIKFGKNLIVVDVEVFDDNDRLIAKGIVTHFRTTILLPDV